MYDRLLSIFAYIVLTGFLLVMILKLQRLDLTALMLVTLALAAWDIFRAERK